MIISFMGSPGSGKSTIAKIIARKLGWPRYNIGDIRRQKAKSKGMTLAEYNKLGETDPSTDIEVDEYQKKLGLTKDNFVIEGRTSWYFIPQSIKIYLDVDEKIGAQRIFSDLKKGADRNEDNNLKTVADVLGSNRQRMASDILRYRKYFNINPFDKKHYDLVIDTTDKLTDEIVTIILKFIGNT